MNVHLEKLERSRYCREHQPNCCPKHIDERKRGEEFEQSWNTFFANLKAKIKAFFLGGLPS